MTEFSVEHRTDRGHQIRFQSFIDWDGNTAIDITALPARWYTNHPVDLRHVAEMATEAADWLEAQSPTDELPPIEDVIPVEDIL
jgi:hypothetical protein